MGTACGGDDDAAPTPARSATTVATSASSTRTVAPGSSPAPATTPKVNDLLPDLQSLGYTLQQSGREASVPAGADMVQAIYQKGTDGNKAMLVKIYVFSAADEAGKVFDAFAEAFKNPPPEVLGADAKNIDALSPNAGDRRKSYATSQADQAGNRVYSDIYVAGKVVVLTQTIDAATTDLMPARTLAAQQVFSRAR